MDHLYKLLDGLLVPFSEDDKNFIRGYWHIVVKALLTPYQRQQEAVLADTINYTQLNEKHFYWPFVPETEVVTISVSEMPMTLPRGLYNLQCTGNPIYHDEVLTLPTRIIDGYKVSCETPGVIIDGNIVLGVGDCMVTWWTNNVTNYTFINNVLNSTEPILTVTAMKGTAASISNSYLCEIMYDKVMYLRGLDTKHVTVGMPVKFRGFRQDVVAEIVDAHRFKVSDVHGSIGENIVCEIDLYPYSYPCEMESIPSFREGYKINIDYIMADGKISFPFPITDTLIALRAYKESNLIEERFINFLSERPTDRELYKIWWHDIFTGGLELFLHAAMGYPYTLPEMGNQHVIGFEYMKEWSHGLEVFTRVDEYNRISGTFAGNETAILTTDGAFYKIVRHYPDGTVELDRTLITFNGESGIFTVSSIILSDDVAAERHIAVPSGCFPVVTPGTIVVPWTKLTTGVRIFDKHERSDYNAFEDVNRFTVPGYTVPPSNDILSMLAYNTFVIEVDSPFSVEDRLVRYLLPSWAQYHVKNRQERIHLFDFSSISGAATLLFAKFLPTDIIPLTSSLDIPEWCENKTYIDADLPRKIIANYDGTEITNIRDEFSVPLDLTPYDINKIVNYIDDIVDPLNVSTFIKDVGKLIITYDAGLTVGNDLEFMFVEQTLLHVFDLTGHREGQFYWAGAGVPPGIIKRVDAAKWFFDAYVEGVPGSSYIPAIYSLGDCALTDRVIQEYAAGIGTILVGNTVKYTDFKRLGIRKLMIYCNVDDAIMVESFTTNGEPVLNSMPVSGTLAGTWGFYCFVTRRADETTAFKD